MHIPFIPSVLLFCCGTYIAEAFSLRRHYRRPVCEPTQSCSYNFKSFTFELCDCPNMQSCPMSAEHGVQLKGITYQFCARRELSMCAENEIASEIFDIQTSIYCECPRDMMYVRSEQDENGNMQYVCKKKATCEPEQICGVGTIAKGIRSHCTCPEGQSCVLGDSNSLNLFSAVNATCQSL